MRPLFLILFVFICNLSFSQTTSSDCTESFILSNNENNNNYTYNAQNSIITDHNYKIVASNNEIRMKAGNVIVLKPNTTIKKGSLYLARIEACTFCGLNFSFADFFTPNGDGYNDHWKVDWNNAIEFSEVSIFDRFGKLIKILKNPFESWDGQYNKTAIFSSDYWFRFDYTDCNGNKKEYKSHFSLKR